MKDNERVELDGIDRYIIYQLQKDARHTSSSDIAEKMDISPSTVRNRIKRLEDEDVINGYQADVNYEKIGYQLYTLIVCTASIPEREELARKALSVTGVVDVQEVMTGDGNVIVTAVGDDGDDLARIGRDLSSIGLKVVDEDVIRNHYTHPYHKFEEENH
ncbi:MAG: Lrp/AsnC family transcriptional regulator [Halobacteria archaeon]